MTRRYFIEKTLRQIYGGQPSDDATITVNLVNAWLGDAIGQAVRKNYTDSIQLDGIDYVNGSFYTTYKGLSILPDDQFLYKVRLPHIPFGIGQNQGVSTLQVKDNSSSQISRSVIWLTQNQKAFYSSMRQIPNKISAYSESECIFIISKISLTQYTAQVCMISGGDSTNLDSTLNVPDDYHNIMVEYIKQQLMFERTVPVDDANDGRDVIKEA